MSKIYKEMQEAIEFGEAEEVVQLVKEAISEKEIPLDIMNLGLIEGMNIVGELFKDGEVYVPEVLMSANAMDAGMEILKPHLKESDIKKKGKIVFCTVKGDLHDIGKKLCVMMLEGAGFEVIDIGVDVGVEQIINGVKEHKPNIVAMSAMLTTTMVTMDEVTKTFKQEGLDYVKIMVGGAPLSDEYAKGISANYSEDAITAVSLADSLIQ